MKTQIGGTYWISPIDTTKFKLVGGMYWMEVSNN